MYHVYGYVEGLLACMFVGGAIVPQTKFDPEETLDAIERHQASDVLLIPTMTLALIDALKKRHVLCTVCVRSFLPAAEPPLLFGRRFNNICTPKKSPPAMA